MADTQPLSLRIADQLFAKIRVRYRDQFLCTLPRRLRAQIRYSVFGYNELIEAAGNSHYLTRAKVRQYT